MGDLRRRINHELDSVEAQLEGRTPPKRIRHPIWAAPVPLTSAQASMVATVGIILALTGYAGSLLTTMIDPVAESFNASSSTLGWVTGASRLGALIALVGSGLSDRLGRRRVMLATMGLAGISALASAAAPNLTLFAIAQVLARSGTNLAGVVCFVAATEEAPEGARAWTLSVTGILGSFGFVLGSALLPLTDLSTGIWRVLFGVGAVNLVMIRPISKTITETRRFSRLASATKSSARGRFREVIDPVYGGRFAVLALAGFLVNAFFAPASQFTNRYLATQRGYSGAGVTILRATVQAFPALVAVWIGGRLSESWGRRPVAVIGLLGTAATTAWFFLAAGSVLGPALLLSTMTLAAAGPALAAFNTELFPTEVRGTAGGALLISTVAGAVVGLVFVGQMAESIPLGTAVALTAIPGVAAAILMLRLPETAGLELDEVSPTELES